MTYQYDIKFHNGLNTKDYKIVEDGLGREIDVIGFWMLDTNTACVFTRSQISDELRIILNLRLHISIILVWCNSHPYEQI